MLYLSHASGSEGAGMNIHINPIKILKRCGLFKDRLPHKLAILTA